MCVVDVVCWMFLVEVFVYVFDFVCFDVVYNEIEFFGLDGVLLCIDCLIECGKDVFVVDYKLCLLFVECVVYVDQLCGYVVVVVLMYLGCIVCVGVVIVQGEWIDLDVLFKLVQMLYDDS